MKNTTLALVRDEAATPMTPPCPHCLRYSAADKNGTAFCCNAAELDALRALRDELDRRLAVELEDPPHDTHAAYFLTWMRERVRGQRRL